jgi:UDP-3-O-[3-hydroxymyristoyl] glucosamine N-acyltransferase
LRLDDLAVRLGATVRGDGATEVLRVKGLEEAGPGDLTFVSNPRYLGKLAATRASAAILSPDVEAPLPALLTKNPYLAFARAVGLLHEVPRPSPGVHPTAHVDPTAELGEGAHVGAFCSLGARTRVGARTVVHPHVTLYDDVWVGDDCVIHSGVQVREGCRLGSRVVVQNGAVIGADGFGFAKDDDGRYQKIPQVGVVVIEDDVEIGALTAVDRAALGETRIGRGTKLDNLVQVGHSVTIGEDSVVAGQTGIAGSTRVGKRVVLAGQVGVVGHLEIGDDVVATAQTGVAHSVEAGTVVSGSPAIASRDWMKATAVFARLPELLRRVRDLERGGAGGKGGAA